MNYIQVILYLYGMDSKIRNAYINNEKWFVGKDICNILLMKDTSMVFKSIDSKYKKFAKIETSGGKQNMLVVNILGIKKIIQSTRSINKKKLIELLNIDMDIIFDFKESNYLNIITSSFKSFCYKTQYCYNKYRIDLYFPDYKLAIEVDEFNHKGRCPIYEKERQEYLEKELGCKFIRFNPDEKNFNIGVVIAEILDATNIIPKSII
jgi:very-short-patch-repair endonuclease